MRRQDVPAADAARISELFAQPRPAYAPSEVLRLLGISAETLALALQHGAVEEHDGGIPWVDVATLALEEWTPRMIAAALGTGAADILPPLNQQRTIRVCLPVYQIRIVEHLARVASAHHRIPRNSSDIIERILHEHANTIVRTLTPLFPGIRHAIQYPSTQGKEP